MIDRLIWLLTLFLVFSCSDSDNEGYIPNIEGDVTIEEGLYGQVIYEEDQGGGRGTIEDFTVQLFSEAPDTTNDPSTSVPIIATKTNDKGFYEIDLEPGDYCLCTGFLRCVQITTSENVAHRIDYSYSSGPGWQTEIRPCL